MIFATIAFYLFSAVLLGSAVMVVAARNPVHSVLFLILAFLNGAGLFVLLGAEFVAMLLIIVYVGAVAVLFLFVVMMLDIAPLKPLMRSPLGIGVGALLAGELSFVISGWKFSDKAGQFLGAPTQATSWMPGLPQTNTHALGRVLYTDYIYVFQIAGLVLLVAMIGAIVLTLHHKKDARRQDTADQIGRPVHAVLEIRSVKIGDGA